MSKVSFLSARIEAKTSFIVGEATSLLPTSLYIYLYALIHGGLSNYTLYIQYRGNGALHSLLHLGHCCIPVIMPANPLSAVAERLSWYHIREGCTYVVCIPRASLTCPCLTLTHLPHLWRQLCSSAPVSPAHLCLLGLH